MNPVIGKEYRITVGRVYYPSAVFVQKSSHSGNEWYEFADGSCHGLSVLRVPVDKVGKLSGNAIGAATLQQSNILDYLGHSNHTYDFMIGVHGILAKTSRRAGPLINLEAAVSDHLRDIEREIQRRSANQQALTQT